jgi:type II secretory pathway component PulK
MKTIIITVENQDQVDAIDENLYQLKREGTLDFAFNIEIKEIQNKTSEPTTTLLEDLEDLVGQLQMDKMDEKQTVEILSNIVEYQKSDHTRNHGDKSIAEQMDEEDELYGKDNPYKDLDDEALSEELYHLENYIVLDYLATKPTDNENKMKHGQLLWLLK